MKKNSLMIFTMVISIAMVLGSCSSTSHIEKADDVNFSRYRSFGWASVDSNLENSNNDIIDANIKKAITAELEKKGLRMTERNPDLLLEYTVSVEKNTRRESSPVYTNPSIQPYYNPSTRRISNYYMPSQFMGYNNNEVAIKNGMMTINMYDARNKKLIWQGWSQNELNKGNITSSEVKQNVRMILKKLDTGS
jgi:Domain of unknown function (DUF4136)